MTGSHADGGLADEAVRLAEALDGWVRRSGLWSGLRDLDQHVATGAPECGVCPVCRSIAAARTAMPQLASRAADTLAAVAVAARTVACIAETASAEWHADAAGAEETASVQEERAWG